MTAALRAQPPHAAPPGMRNASPFASRAVTRVSQVESFPLGAMGCMGGFCHAGGAQPPEKNSPTGLWLSTGSIPVPQHSSIPWHTGSKGVPAAQHALVTIKDLVWMFFDCPKCRDEESKL